MTFRERLASGAPLITDGGTGTERRRLACGAAEVHAAFVAVGAEVIVADSITAAGLCVTDAAGGAAALASAVGIARASGARFVAASLGPSGPAVRDATHRRQVYDALAGAAKSSGADVIFAETLLTFFDADAAVAAARGAGLPVVVTFAFGRDGRGYAGLEVATTALWAWGLGLDASGINCGDDAESSLAAFQRWTDALPAPRDWVPDEKRSSTVFRPAAPGATPEDFAELGHRAVVLGAKIVGGCCGATPAHIAALVTRIAAGQRFGLV